MDESNKPLENKEEREEREKKRRFLKQCILNCVSYKNSSEKFGQGTKKNFKLATSGISSGVKSISNYFKPKPKTEEIEMTIKGGNETSEASETSKKRREDIKRTLQEIMDMPNLEHYLTSTSTVDSVKYLSQKTGLTSAAKGVKSLGSQAYSSFSNWRNKSKTEKKNQEDDLLGGKYKKRTHKKKTHKKRTHKKRKQHK